MVIEVKEVNYYGFICKYEDDGWTIVLNGKEIKFPTLQDAQMAVSDFWESAIKNHKGKEKKA